VGVNHEQLAGLATLNPPIKLCGVEAEPTL